MHASLGRICAVLFQERGVFASIVNGLYKQRTRGTSEATLEAIERLNGMMARMTSVAASTSPRL